MFHLFAWFMHLAYWVPAESRQSFTCVGVAERITWMGPRGATPSFVAEQTDDDMTFTLQHGSVISNMTSLWVMFSLISPSFPVQDSVDTRLSECLRQTVSSSILMRLKSLTYQRRRQTLSGASWLILHMWFVKLFFFCTSKPWKMC